MLNLFLSIGLLIFCVIVLIYLYRGALYVPTHKKTVEEMMRIINPRSGLRVADLGSGDGRIIIAAALAGADSVGFEINPLLVWYSRVKTAKFGLKGKVLIKNTDFWREDLSSFDVVIVFGITHIMKKLAKKLILELKPESIVISNAFQLPGLTEVEKTGSLYVYRPATETG